ncbi:hypothetical protein LTR37_021250, partial [Vermiconidia calcicola]
SASDVDKHTAGYDQGNGTGSSIKAQRAISNNEHRTAGDDADDDSEDEYFDCEE